MKPKTFDKLLQSEKYRKNNRFDKAEQENEKSEQEFQTMKQRFLSTFEEPGEVGCLGLVIVFIFIILGRMCCSNADLSETKIETPKQKIEMFE